MKQVTDADKLFYFEKNFFTLDGLWMIETEKFTDWGTALKIDLEVWKRLLTIIIRRIKNYLQLESNSLKNLIEILTFRWSVEGWDYEIQQNEEKEVKIQINICPYKAIMDRNPDRRDRIPKICNDMCKPFYSFIIEEFNPNIKLNRTIMSRKADCDFHFKIEE